VPNQETPYLLIADIVNSTEIGREELTRIVKAIEKRLKKWNKDFSKDLLVPMRLSYGDEIAGLFLKPEHIFTIVRELRRIVYQNSRIRFVVIKDKIGSHNMDITKIGGAVFKRANEELNRIKEENLFCFWDVGDQTLSQTLTALTELTNYLIEQLSDYQKSIYALFELGLNQKEIATKLGKFPQSAWKVMRKSKIPQIHYGEKTIELLLMGK